MIKKVITVLFSQKLMTNGDIATSQQGRQRSWWTGSPIRSYLAQQSLLKWFMMSMNRVESDQFRSMYYLSTFEDCELLHKSERIWPGMKNVTGKGQGYLNVAVWQIHLFCLASLLGERPTTTSSKFRRRTKMTFAPILGKLTRPVVMSNKRHGSRRSTAR